MFITGPDVIKTVTHEDVTKEELGGAHTHASKSGVCHFTARNDSRCIARSGELLCYLPSNNPEDPPAGASSDDPGDREDARARHHGARGLQQAVRHQEADRGGGRRRRVLRGAAPSTPGTSSSASRASAAAASASSPTSPPCWPACSTSTPAQGGALRALLRRLQHPAGDLRRRARASCRAPSRSTAASSSTAPSCCTPTPRPPCQAHGHHPQGLRRRLRRDGVQAHSRRRQPRVPDRRDRRDGAGGRSQHRLPPRDQPRQAIPPARRARWSRDYRDKFANPYKAAELGFVDEVIAPRQTRPQIARALRQLRGKRVGTPPKKHGNMPL